MKDQIEKILKNRIGTSFIYEKKNGNEIFKLTSYGQGVFIIFNEGMMNKKFTRVLRVTKPETFIVVIEQDQKNFDELLVASVKMMIDTIKKEHADKLLERFKNGISEETMRKEIAEAQAKRNGGK